MRWWKPPARSVVRSLRAPAHHGRRPQPTPRPQAEAGSGEKSVAMAIRMGDEEVGAAAGGLITTVPRPPTSRLQPCTLACRAWLARTT